MAHVVMCRLCHQRFDMESEEGIKVGKQSYYHKKCYDEWKNGLNDAKGNMATDFWYEALVDYLYRDVKMGNMDFTKIQSQWNNFIKPGRGFTPKGIYFAIRFFYEVKHGDAEKSLGGIGIVPSIYSQSAQYWTERENQKAGTLEAIIEQIKARDIRPVVEIKRKVEKKTKQKWDIEQV